MPPKDAYTEELGDAICEKIASGRSLRSICQDEGMPDKATVMRWLGKTDVFGAPVHAAFCDQYVRARELQADTLFDDILDIADDARNDFTTKTNAEGETDVVVNQEHIQRSRLRVDARKWMAGKLRPKKYGDKVTVGGDPDSPLMVPVINVRLSDS